MAHPKSRDVARQLGVPYHVLYHAIHCGRLAPPEKDSAGDFVWGPEDVERARQALASRRRPTPEVPCAQ